jgi:hypothetical protein
MSEEQFLSNLKDVVIHVLEEAIATNHDGEADVLFNLLREINYRLEGVENERTYVSDWA